ncbi:alpha/beta-hydrolase [Viridothelium virens]|uniref:Alpha/beta-hydrolase n=1 Tax=Viridothelium virens TaxID=1048519 RepID=A0A6A6H0Q5_VIRVR|nr:alpha/beta-hydrolase [Viridothelium virens]
MASESPAETPIIPHQSLNPTAPTTILLIHGALSTSEEWNLVAPHLQPTYHLLIPDLPRHGASTALTPFTIPHTTTLLAHLILTHAHNSAAHIVGLSLGAHLAVHFAATHPTLVLSVFATGLSRFGGGPNPTLFAYGFHISQALERAVPPSLIQRALPDLDLSCPRTASSVSLCREIEEVIRAVPAGFPKRVLVVAGAKGGWVPTGDSVESARVVGGLVGRGEGGEASRCVVHWGMRHAWSRQDPRLFARAVEAWVERGEVLEGEGFESLL